LRLWGSEYTTAMSALALLVVANFVNASLGLHQWVVVMSGRPTLDLINNVCALVCATVVCFLAIPALGLLGAAIGALAAVGTLRGLQLVESWWLEGVHGFSSTWIRLAIAGALSAAVQLAIRAWLGHGVPAAAVGTAVGIAAYIAIVGISQVSAVSAQLS